MTTSSEEKKEPIPMTDLERELMLILDTTAYHYAKLIKKYFDMTKEEEKGEDNV